MRITPPAPNALRFSTASNRRFAHEDVQRLMRIVELPRSARLVAKLPKSVPSRFRNMLSGTRLLPGFAVMRRIWIVREPLDRVFRYVRANAQPRPRPMAPFRGKNNGVLVRRDGSYRFPPVPGRSWDRWLNTDMVALQGGGTVVIAQTGDAWIHAPHHLLLPGGVKRIDVLSKAGRGAPNVLVHVHERYDVGSIVALFNGLGLSDAERVACAWDFSRGPIVTLRFRAASGALLARATASDAFGGGGSGPCNPFQVTVRGRAAPPLIGDLLLQVQRLLNVDLAPPVPRDVANCLGRDGWKTHRERLRALPPELSARKNGRRWRITFHYSGKVTLDKAGPPRALEHCLHAGQRYAIAG